MTSASLGAIALHIRIDSARWHRKGHWGVITLVPLLLLSGTPGCDHYDSLEQIRADRTLTVVTRNGPTTYYRGSEGPTGFEYTLAQRFADHLGVKLVIREAPSLQDLFQQLGSRRAQLATASLAASGICPVVRSDPIPAGSVCSLPLRTASLPAGTPPFASTLSSGSTAIVSPFRYSACGPRSERTPHRPWMERMPG